MKGVRKVETRTPKFGDKPEAVDFTIHYSDGTRETIRKGLVAIRTPAGAVEAVLLGMTVEDFLMVLAALEGSAKDIVANAQ